VFVSYYPMVEFVGADNFEGNGQMASIIKTREGKHLRPGESLPIEYVSLPVDLYTHVVTGPYAAGSMAVIADKDDLTTMAHHGLIRAYWKKGI